MRTLHTIGYEGSSIDDFLATIHSVGIDLIIDVRDVPISRKKGFSKRKLADHLESMGIEYMHLKGLGDPKAGRLAARAGRYDEFRRVFGSHMKTDVAREHLNFAVEAAQDRIACLLCFERDHTNCHRCIVATEMASLGAYRLRHLGVRANLSIELGFKTQRKQQGALAFAG
jgi:uncharacterized protein (DUF488 family)